MTRFESTEFNTVPQPSATGGGHVLAQNSVAQLMVQHRRYPSNCRRLEELSSDHDSMLSNVARCKDSLLPPSAPGNYVRVEVGTLGIIFLSKLSPHLMKERIASA